MLRRRLLLAASGLLATPSLVRGAMVRRSGGGGPGTVTPPGDTTIIAPTGTLVNAYGTWGWGDKYVPGPGWAGGVDQYFVTLNGKPAYGQNLKGPVRLTLSSGDIYGWEHDQQWWLWRNYDWKDMVSSPDFVPTPGVSPTPNYSPPYTPSADGTAVSGGVGSLTTVDGVWTFGAPGPFGGYLLMLNGIVATQGTGFTDMQVNAFGQMFMRQADSGQPWYAWNAMRFQPSAGPTSGPIPVNASFDPPLNDPMISSPVGTFITTVSVVTSNGSPFAGTLAIGGAPTQLTMSPSPTTGPNVVTAVSPVVAGGFAYNVTATQNGTSFQRPSAINLRAG
jgi:hypothetical protein